MRPTNKLQNAAWAFCGAAVAVILAGLLTTWGAWHAAQGIVQDAPPAVVGDAGPVESAPANPQPQRFGWLAQLHAAQLPAGAAAAPPAELMGWAGEEQAKAARKAIGDELPELRYAVESAPETGNRCVRLWDLTRLVNAGKHLPNIRQEIGDCVSHGTSNAVEYSLCASLVASGKYARWHEVYQPYIYGVSRVQIGGGRIRGDGSVGAWAAKGVQDYGVLAADFPGVPAYSGSIAKRWGAPPGPPKEFLAEGKKHPVEARMVKSFQAACEAISCGNAVAVCSGQGFNQVRERNGRIEGVPTGSWAHCMSFVGFDTRAGREGLYCLNSWGPNAHAAAERYAALDGAPPGGFWVDEKTADRMLSAGDSYAYSFTGFAAEPVFPLLDSAPIEAEPYIPSSKP